MYFLSNRALCMLIISVSINGISSKTYGQVETSIELTSNTNASKSTEAKSLTESRKALVKKFQKYYKQWDLADNGSFRFSPILCRIPSRGSQTLHYSKSDDENSHGMKLYRLYARDRAAYEELNADGERLEETDSSLWGQILVKESYSADSIDKKLDEHKGEIHRSVSKDGKHYEPGEFKGLYMMIHLGKHEPDTDEGWIYATVDAKTKEIHVGKIESCMNCHQDAPNGRLFGFPEVDYRAIQNR